MPATLLKQAGPRNFFRNLGKAMSHLETATGHTSGAAEAAKKGIEEASGTVNQQLHNLPEGLKKWVLLPASASTVAVGGAYGIGRSHGRHAQLKTQLLQEKIKAEQERKLPPETDAKKAPPAAPVAPISEKRASLRVAEAVLNVVHPNEPTFRKAALAYLEENLK